MRRVLASLMLPVLLAGLAGCQTAAEQEEVAVVTPRPQGIDGRWASIGGAVAYNISFNSGRYTATQAQTNGLLAEGTYTNLGPGQVTVNYRSVLRGNRVAVNCNQIEQNRLACVTSSGERYDFSRA